MPQTMGLSLEQDLEHLPEKLVMRDEVSTHETRNVKDEAIPTIQLRAATFIETSKPAADPQPSTSPAPSSPGLTACETSSTISIEEGVELAQLDDEQRQQMIADVFIQLDQLVGLPHVKDQFLEIKKTIEAYQKQGVNLKRERFHIKFLGNPGTGKL